MRILVYAGNLSKGGAVQAGFAFIYGIVNEGYGHKWLCVLSPILRELRGIVEVPHATFQRAVASGCTALGPVATPAYMRHVEEKFKPDVAYSIFGPPYWFPRVPHLCGFALGWMISPESPIWGRLGIMEKARIKGRNRIKRAFFRRSWNYLVETQTAANRLGPLLGLPRGNIHVVPNCASRPFHDAASKKGPAHPGQGVFRFLAIGADYPHKNFRILPDMAREIKRLTDQPFSIVTTLPQSAFDHINDLARRHGVAHNFENAGQVPVTDCPTLYASCHALLLPTLMEIFSASYHEAMILGLPILTSNLPFAWDVCDSAAEYFDPVSAESIAAACVRIIKDQIRYRELAELGRRKGATYPNPSEKFELTIEILERIVAGKYPLFGRSSA